MKKDQPEPEPEPEPTTQVQHKAHQAQHPAVS